MQQPLPHTLIYTSLCDLNTGVYPEIKRYAIDSSKSYYLFVEHFHSEHELIYVSKGTYRAKLNGVDIELNTGDILIVCPGDYHLDAVYEGLEFHAINFHLRSNLFSNKTIRLFKENIGSKQQIIPFFSDLLKNTFHVISSEIRNLDPLPKMISSQLHAIFWRIVKQISLEHLSKQMIIEVSGNSFSVQLNRVISENLYVPSLSVHKLSSLMNMSPAKLTKLCAEHLNNSPAKLILEVKLNVAKYLLARRDMNIKEISNFLCFSDQFSFSRTFKRRTGLSPREFRKKLQRSRKILKNLKG
jgi:AraC-like DNA-binding protein